MGNKQPKSDSVPSPRKLALFKQVTEKTESSFDSHNDTPRENKHLAKRDLHRSSTIDVQLSLKKKKSAIGMQQRTQDINVQQAVKRRQPTCIDHHLERLRYQATSSILETPRSVASLRSLRSVDGHKKQFTAQTQVLLQRQADSQHSWRKVEFDVDSASHCIYKELLPSRNATASLTLNKYKLIKPRQQSSGDLEVEEERGNGGVVSLLREAATVKYEPQRAAGRRTVIDFRPALSPRTPATVSSSPMTGATGNFAQESERRKYRIKTQACAELLEKQEEQRQARSRAEKVWMWKGSKGTNPTIKVLAPM